MDIISHSMHGITVAQRSIDGYLNATKLAKAYEKAIGKRKDVANWIKTQQAQEFIEVVSLETGISVSKLIETRKGKPADLQGTYIHPDLAIAFATWLSPEFMYKVTKWIQEWAKGAYQQQPHQCRILESPKPWTLTFERTFESELSRLSGLHKNDIRNGRLYWEFIYSWMTAEDRAKHEESNPVLANGRRKHKIHQMLDEATKQGLTEHIQCVMNYMLIANSVAELRRMVQRRYGIDQPSLFDGLDSVN